MGKKIPILLLAGIMAMSSFAFLAGDYNVQFHQNYASAYASQGGTYNGNVTINSTGQITGTGTGSVPVVEISSSGGVFQLSENINGTFTDMMNGSTIMGAGYGINSSGIFLNGVNGVSISDLNLSDGSYGVNIIDSSHMALSDLNFNGSSTEIQAVSISHSSYVYINGSTFNKDPAGRLGAFIYSSQSNYVGIQNNSYNGPTLGSLSNFISTVYTSNVAIKNNTVVSATPLGTAFSVSNGNGIVVANNRVTNLTGISVSTATDLTTFGNVFYHSVNTAISGSNIDTFSSHGDRAYNTTGYDVHMTNVGRISISGGYFNNSTAGIFLSNYGTLDFENSNFSSNYSASQFTLQSGGTTRVDNSSFYLPHSTYTAFADSLQTSGISITNSLVYNPLGNGIFIDGSGASAIVSNTSVTSIGGISVNGPYFNSVSIVASSFTQTNPVFSAILVSFGNANQNVSIDNNTITTLTGRSSNSAMFINNPYTNNLNIVGNIVTNFSNGIQVDNTNPTAYVTTLISNNTLTNL